MEAIEKKEHRAGCEAVEWKSLKRQMNSADLTVSQKL